MENNQANYADLETITNHARLASRLCSEAIDSASTDHANVHRCADLIAAARIIIDQIPGMIEIDRGAAGSYRAVRYRTQEEVVARVCELNPARKWA